MKVSKWIAMLLLTGIVLVGGCVFDDDDDDDDDDGKDITRIEELTVGGYVFVIPEQGFAMAQAVTFNGDDPFDDADVYINGMLLAQTSGLHANAEPIDLEGLNAGDMVRIAVYAFEDSLIHEVAIPDTPQINEPADGTVMAVGEPLAIDIKYPGAHDYIAFSIVGQGVYFGTETDETLVTATVEAERIQEVGEQQLNAYSSNASGDIPDEGFSITDPRSVFIVASVSSRNFTVTGSSE